MMTVRYDNQPNEPHIKPLPMLFATQGQSFEMPPHCGVWEGPHIFRHGFPKDQEVSVSVDSIEALPLIGEVSAY